MTATYVLLVQHIEEVLNSSQEPGHKCEAIQRLIRDARNDEGEPDDDRR